MPVRGARTIALRTARQRLDPTLFSVQLFSALTGLGRDEAIEKLSAWLTPLALQTHGVTRPVDLEQN